MYALYGALVLLGWILLLPYQFVSALVRGGPRARLRERLGMASGGAPVAPGGLWIHAVSVGEVRLALLLLVAVRERHPGLPVTVTTGTPTGRALAERGVPGTSPPDRVAFLPIDRRGPMGRFLERIRPAALLLVETEIWPNLLRLCAERGVPVSFVNGRISPRSFPRYRRVRWFLRRCLGDVTLFAMQSEEDAERIRALGAPPERVRVTGNMKFDLPLPRSAAGPAARERLGIPADRPLFVAGSTAPGEERAAAEALRALRRIDPRTLLVLAPRHPEDFAAAETRLIAAGLRVARYSGPFPGRETDAVLVDAMGVLPDLYAAADLVFVGGSLVSRGGQNPLEPASLGRPVLFGPDMENFADAARALVAAGGGFVVRDGGDLGRQAARLLADAGARRAAGEAARRAVESGRGALPRTLAFLEGLMRGGPGRAERAAAAGA
jgi:3-deoxy-D-manno-octulosonic-acid transferase